MSTSNEELPVPHDVAPADLPVPPAVVEIGEPHEALAKVGARYIWLQVLAQFGVFVAFITPLAISLSIRINSLAPGHEEYLGYITGSGALVVMFTSPLLGVFSDRTRSPIGRRRPWMIGGMVLGVISLLVMASAPTVLLLGFGWILAQLGWGQVLGNLQTNMADRLPESQRGKVAGLSGFATQIAPVFGVIISGAVAANPFLLFLIPGAIGVVLVTLFVAFIKEESTVGAVFADKLSIKTTFAKYLFNPKKYADFSLNWLGRFLFYFGLTLATTFTAFFFAWRLGVDVVKVAGIIGILGLVGIFAVSLGAIGGGFLSDRLKRRRVFVLVGAIFFAAGVVIQAFSGNLAGLVVGSLTASVGIGAFSAVDQALLLDVLPERETDAGRFMGITGFATSIPQATAPFLATFILAIGVTGGGKNYQLLYIIAGAVTLLGALIVLRIRSVR
jgi:MFS family permease